MSSDAAPAAQTSLASLLARRAAAAQSRPPPPDADWRREELWKHDPAAAAASYESGHTFGYSFDDSSVPRLTLQEDSALIGSRVWDGGTLTGKLLEKRGPAQLLALRPAEEADEPLRVLELGCGTGLLGMVCARLLQLQASTTAAAAAPTTGPLARVTLTDIPAVVHLTEKQVAANGFATEPALLPVAQACGAGSLAVAVACKPLTWGSEGEEAAALEWLGGRPHLLLMSDPAAPAAVVPSLVDTLLRLMPPGQAQAGTASTAPAMPTATPMLLLCVHSHREFTAPLLEAVGQVKGYSMRRLGQEELHGQYISDKHVVYEVRPG